MSKWFRWSIFDWTKESTLVIPSWNCEELYFLQYIPTKTDRDRSEENDDMCQIMEEYDNSFQRRILADALNFLNHF